MILSLRTLICCLSIIEQCWACHWTNIVVRNGTWCCGGNDGGQADVGGNITLPPGPVTPPETTTTTTVDTTTTEVETTTTMGETTTSALPPVGDCPCGANINSMDNVGEWNTQERILSQDPEGTEKLSRPWIVKIVLPTGDGRTDECTGSLLNKRYVITAAHCFCNNIIPCTPDDGSEFQRIITVDDVPNFNNINLTFGYSPDASKIQRMEGISKLFIHPDYYHYTPETVVGHTDVALIMTNTDVFRYDSENPTKLSTSPHIEPICLPPKLGYVPGNTDGANEAFNDLDCVMTDDSELPYPFYNKSGQVLSCHPGGLTHANDINIMGRTSYITGYGSTTREDPDEQVRVQCTTNSYGPLDSILKECFSKCHTNYDFEVLVNPDDGSDDPVGVRSNPSLVDIACNKFREENLDEVLRTMKEEWNGDMTSIGRRAGENGNASFPGFIKLQTGAGEHWCWPFVNQTVLKEAKNMYDYPYKHGWCSVCSDDPTEDCIPRPNSGWGWCQPHCDQNKYQPPVDDVIHEAAVDSFLYEDCSKNVNLATEFCTGVPVVGGYGQEWGYTYDGWKKIGNLIRSSSKDFPANTPTHTSQLGDVCYGDAGGSVWKYWMFRDSNDDTYARTRKLAVLTGVISRYEEHCGAFAKDGPPQHSVHTRVTSVLDWINQHISDGRCQPLPDDSAPQNFPPDFEEYNEIRGNSMLDYWPD